MARATANWTYGRGRATRESIARSVERRVRHGGSAGESYHAFVVLPCGQLLLGGRTLVQICEIHRKFKLRGSMAEWVAAAGLPGLCAARSVALRSSAMRPRRKTSLSGRVGGACSLDLEDAEPAGTTRSWRESSKRMWEPTTKFGDLIFGRHHCFRISGGPRSPLPVHVYVIKRAYNA